MDKRKLIQSIKLDTSNLEHIMKTGEINGTLLSEILRVMEENTQYEMVEVYDLRQRVQELQNTCIELGKRAVYTEDEKKTYWEYECKCGFKSISLIAIGGGQIADTGDYDDVRCPVCRSIVD